MSTGRPIALQQDEFEIEELNGLRVKALVGFTDSDADDNPDALLMTLSDGSNHYIYLSAYVCFWSEADSDDVADVTSDFAGCRRIDYCKKHGLTDASVKAVTCWRGTETILTIRLSVGDLSFSEVDGDDPTSDAQFEFLGS